MHEICSRVANVVGMTDEVDGKEEGKGRIGVWLGGLQNFGEADSTSDGMEPLVRAVGVAGIM